MSYKLFISKELKVPSANLRRRAFVVMMQGNSENQIVSWGKQKIDGTEIGS